VAGGGALVSELPPGTGVQRYHFPRRNRLISGLALGTLVVEASVTSGALITARHAAEQDREVFAIPGSIHNPLARGCHRLIRDGAKLVETAADIVEELGGALGALAARADSVASPPAADAPADDPAYAQLLDALGFDPVGVDTLVARSGLTTGEVSSMLLMLELQGRVQSLSGARYQRAR
jgi:DNA processing protein